MNDAFKKNSLMWGEDGKKWLEEIPKIISTYEKKWSIQVQSPFELSYNYVAPAIRKEGIEAVIKIGFYKDKEFKSEVNALEAFNGKGVIKLLEKDMDNSVILIERVKPGKPLATLNNDEQETRILAKMIRKISRPLNNLDGFIALKQWRKELDEYCKTDGNELFPIKLARRACELFDYLIDTSEESVLVHGDLHHDNVLSLNNGGWVVIDPKGVVAEPCFEVATMIRNPYKRLLKIEKLEKLLCKRIMILAEDLKFEPKRIRQWCLAETVLTGVWCMKDKKLRDHAIRVAKALENIKI